MYSTQNSTHSTHTSLDLGQTSDCSRMLGYEIQAELCQNGSQATQPQIYIRYFTNKNIGKPIC